MRIGVDVGGTHTDAVIMDGASLVAVTKALTSADIASGVIEAVRAVLAQSGLAAPAIKMITIGTTQFTNAIVERRELSPVAALRIGAQSSAALPIGAKWPADISAAAILSGAMADGGHEYDGTPITPLDDAAIEGAIEAAAAAGAEAVAVTSVFATANPDAEKNIAEKIRERLPGAALSLSHELGRIGLYQRENATILNAALMALAEKVVTAFEDAFAALSLSCPLFLSQNDGTLMSADYARRYPVFTFSSGPTNSMRGAAYLSGLANAMVVDVGGTTSDIGMLIDGFPRPSGTAVEIGGVLTNFRMPDVLALGLGGGSIVSADGARVGPQSVGRDLVREGRVFGGDVLTASDVAVATARADFGDKTHVSNLDAAVAARASEAMSAMLARGVDRMKTSAEPAPLIVVGGGGFLAPDMLPGVSEVIRPQNAGVANAIGAAFAQIGGEAEVIYSASTRPRDEALSAAKKRATERAIGAGADPQTTDIVEVEETPMSYMSEPGAVIRVKAVGDADLSRFAAQTGAS
ncbi:MAG: hydantoinase/oxoprolinase family protein [Pseudomonadota bacterium]